MMDEATDYDVTIIVRNGRLKAAMRQAGYYTTAALYRACGLHQTIIGAYLTLRQPPYNRNGRLRPSAERLCTFLGRSIEELFPESALTRALVVNSVTVGMSERQVAGIIDGRRLQALLDAPPSPEEAREQDEAGAALQKAIARLPSERMRDVVRMRFGLEPYDHEHTLDECGDKHSVTRERVRQIELKAMDKLRHPVLIRETGLQAAADTFHVRNPR